MHPRRLASVRLLPVSLLLQEVLLALAPLVPAEHLPPLIFRPCLLDRAVWSM